MKKIFAAFMCFVLCLSLFSACAGVSNGDSDANNNASASDEEEILSLCRKIQDARGLFHEFVDFGEMYPDESGQWKMVSSEDMEKLPQDLNPYPGINYVLVNEYNSLREFKEKVLEYYCLDTANMYFFTYFDEGGEWLGNGDHPYLLEADGKLWVDCGALGGGDRAIYNTDSVQIKSIDGDKAVVSVEYHVIDDYFTKDIPLVKENGEWKFESLV